MPDGSPAASQELLSGLRMLASSYGVPTIAKAVAAEALTQVRLGFREGHDPYGATWAPVSSRPGGSPLRNKGRLANSFTARATGGVITVGTNVPWAATHQHGATIRPKRAKALSFKVQVQRLYKSAKAQMRQQGVAIASAASVARGGTAARMKTQTQQAFAQQVTIPRRQMLPEGSLPSAWERAFARAADLAAERAFDRMRGA